MGQKVLSDEAARNYLCERLLTLGEKLASQEICRPPEEVVAGQSFRAILRVIADYERDDDSLCVQVGLVRRGRSGTHRKRFLYLRCERAGRRLDKPRTWRMGLGGPLGFRHAHHRKLTFAELSRDIYWSANAPPEDLAAQVVIALAQLELLPRRSALDWLTGYLGHFRARISSAVPSAEREQARAAVRWIAAGHLLGHWSFPEDWRGFRKYACNCVKRAFREYLGSAHSHHEAEGEPSYVPAEVEDTLVEKLSRADREAGRKIESGAKDPVSVTRAAEILGWDKGYLHRLICQGVIRALPGKRRAISPEELQRLRQIRGARLERRRLAKRLEESGKTVEAARKAVYRKYGRSPRVVPQRPDRRV